MYFKTKRAIVPAGHWSLLLIPLGEAAGFSFAGQVGQQHERATFRCGEFETWEGEASCEITAVCVLAHIYKGIED